jgi:hypothetical protein
MSRTSISALGIEAKQKYSELVNRGLATNYPNLVNPVKIEGETATIYCYSKGNMYEAYIDTEDLPKIAIGYAIAIVNKGKGEGKTEALYCRVGCNTGNKPPESNKGETIHRIVTDCPADMVVDHINHNGLDNRKSNLRIMSHEENMIYKKLATTNKTGKKNITYKDGYYNLTIKRGFINRQYAEEALEKIYDIIQHYSALDAREKADKRINGA